MKHRKFLITTYLIRSPQTYNNTNKQPNKTAKKQYNIKITYRKDRQRNPPHKSSPDRRSEKTAFFLFAPHSWRNFAAIYRDTTTAKWNIISETSKSGGARRGLAKALTRRSPRAIARSFTSSTCFPTLRAPACTSVTRCRYLRTLSSSARRQCAQSHGLRCLRAAC